MYISVDTYHHIRQTRRWQSSGDPADSCSMQVNIYMNSRYKIYISHNYDDNSYTGILKEPLAADQRTTVSCAIGCIQQLRQKFELLVGHRCSSRNISKNTKVLIIPLITLEHTKPCLLVNTAKCRSHPRFLLQSPLPPAPDMNLKNLRHTCTCNSNISNICQHACPHQLIQRTDIIQPTLMTSLSLS